MYFPIGWPKVLKLQNLGYDNKNFIRQLVFNRDKIFFCVISEDTLYVYNSKTCLLLALHRRSKKSIRIDGENELAEWRPDSSCILITTSNGTLLFYKIEIHLDQKFVYEQIDPPQTYLKRDNADLFPREQIVPITVKLIKSITVGKQITNLTCIRDEIMVCTSNVEILRFKWDGSLNRDYCVDLRRVPFCIDNLVTKAIPITEKNVYIVQIEYSPLIGGFAIVFNDGRSAFLTASSLKFDPNQMQGIWTPAIDDATCAQMNHKFRLITIGRKNSQAIVYCIDETTGGLLELQKLIIPDQTYPGVIGAVTCMKWSPDSCVMALSWETGGFAVWSTFGALLMCSLSWDYGLNVDLSLSNPINIFSMDWSAEGYGLWMIKRAQKDTFQDDVIMLNFVKSALTVNPCISHNNSLYLQGDDKIYVNLGLGLCNTSSAKLKGDNSGRESPLLYKTTLIESKQWIVIQIPHEYSDQNWPIRFTAIDSEGTSIAVAGRLGFAHYSLVTKKWKLFGNETQEKDFLVTGGLLWWRNYVVSGCYNIPKDTDELRLYPSDQNLSNDNMVMIYLGSQPLLLDVLKNLILVFTADGRIAIYSLKLSSEIQGLLIQPIRVIDISGFCVHPACFVSISLTTIRTEPVPIQKPNDQYYNCIINVSGRILLVNLHENSESRVLGAPSVLATCVESIWTSSSFCKFKPHLTEALWLFCGTHMRVWLPLFPRQGESSHSFISKRIMLPFPLKIYPIAILFRDAILLGVENDTTLYTSDPNSAFSLPFCVLERTSQVYLHQILRQLIRRNLGFHAYEIARCCMSLPYFPHSLELLLHEVLEEEATSKDPIPDGQLPSVIEFIKEFPVYPEAIVQCARKTEIALWPYLFSAVGSPKQLFQKCLIENQLETAASYLIILQNLESSFISRQVAITLLDAALNGGKWELSKELVRFLKAIDPNDAENSRNLSSVSRTVLPSNYGILQTPPVNPNEEDLSLLLGTFQVSRGRSFSTTIMPKVQGIDKYGSNKGANLSEISVLQKKASFPSHKSESLPKVTEEIFVDEIIQKHAKKLLKQCRLSDLGTMVAVLDFPLVPYLLKEKNRGAIITNIIQAFKTLHADFNWPYPTCPPSLYDSIVNESMDGNNNESSPSQVRDSGYVSCVNESPRLIRKFEKNQNNGIDDQSLLSECESLFYQDDINNDLNTIYSIKNNMFSLDLVNGNNHGNESNYYSSNSSEIKLRYLLQLIIDAGCLQWAFLISVILKDAMAVQRVIYSTKSNEQSFEDVVRLRDDIVTLCQWSCNECLGYRTFMLAIQGQVMVLNRILLNKQKNDIIHSPQIRSRTTSLSMEPAKISRSNSINKESVNSVLTEKTTEIIREQPSKSCVIS